MEQFKNQKKIITNKNVVKFVGVEIDDFPVFSRTLLQKSNIRILNSTGVDEELRKKERQSLANFEDFENTLLNLALERLYQTV